MHVHRLLPAAALASILFAPINISAQASSSQNITSVANAVELNPILVNTDDSNRGKSEVVLSIDLDSKGAVAHAAAISGPRDLINSAIADARMFRYADHPNTSGALQHILFRGDTDEVRMVTPDYPEMAIRAHAAGIVQLVATINQDGHVTDVTVVSGHPLLRNEAEKALRQSVFAPVRKNGVAVSFHAIVSFNFDPNRFPN